MGIGAKQEGGMSGFAGAEGDPERSAHISDEAEHGVKVAITNQFFQAGIIESPERFLARAFVGNFQPGVTVKKRNVPFHIGLKIGVESRFRAAQRAVRNSEVELRVGRHLTKNRRHILDRMRCHGKNLEAWVWHVVLRVWRGSPECEIDV